MPGHKAAQGTVAGEEKLVRRAQAGDANAFAVIYDAYLERIHRYVSFRVADEDTAQDITSQTFLKAWDRIETFQPGRLPFLGWLYRIAHNAVVDHYRAARPQVSLDQAQPSQAGQTRDVDDQVELHLETLRLRSAMEKLTEDQQRVITLRFIVGLSTAETALELGKEPGAVRALQMRAVQSLARGLRFETE